MKKEKWLVAAKKADFNAWANVFHISPVLARIIRDEEYHIMMLQTIIKDL